MNAEAGPPFPLLSLEIFWFVRDPEPENGTKPCLDSWLSEIEFKKKKTTFFFFENFPSGPVV